MLVGVFGIPLEMAQTTGTISGIVRDGAGAVIPGASVTAKRITRTLATDEQGSSCFVPGAASFV